MFISKYYYDHYIELDDKDNVIDGFSTAFRKPTDTSILLTDKGKRHFELLGEINPNLITINGLHLYKYDNGEVRKSTEEELKLELKKISNKKRKPTKEELLIEQVNELTISQAEILYELSLKELDM